MEQLNCPNCGGKMTLLRGGAKARCEICDTEAVMNNGRSHNTAITDKENIAGVMELTATGADLHNLLVLSLIRTPFMPLNLLSSLQVLSVDHFLVSGFLFECEYSINYTYEVGNERTVVTHSSYGGNISSEKESVVDWTVMNDRLESSDHIIVSGAKELENCINAIWARGDIGSLTEIESAGEQPAGTIEIGYNLSPNAVFENQVKPTFTESARAKVRRQLNSTRYRNLNTASPAIRKTLTRILLSAVKVNYFYNGQDYQLWVSGDGQRYYTEAIPVDNDRKQKYHALKLAASKNQPSIVLIVILFLVAGAAVSLGYAHWTGWAVFLLCTLIPSWLIVRYRKVDAAIRAFTAFEEERRKVVRLFIAKSNCLAGCLEESARTDPRRANPPLSEIV